MAERQIEHRKSRPVIPVRFPFVNWRSRSFAKSAYQWVKVKHQQNLKAMTYRLFYFSNVSRLEHVPRKSP